MVTRLLLGDHQTMRATTLFSAYQRCIYRLAAARTARGTSLGISIDSDYWAKCFQRYQRLANLLETKLEKILRDVDQQHWKERPGKFSRMFPSTETEESDHGLDRTETNSG